MNIRRILAIILFIAVSIGIGFGLYYFFFRGAGAPTTNVPGTTTNQPTGTGGLPTAGTGGGTTLGGTGTTTLPEQTPQQILGGPAPIASGGNTIVTPVSPSPTVSATISSSGQVNYYNREDGKFYYLGPNGTVSTLSDKTFYNVKQATFDPKGNKAVLEYPDGSNIVYDFIKNQQVTLPTHWENFAFSPNGSELAAKSVALDPNSRFLVTVNADGSGGHAIQELGENQDKVAVNWSPNNQIVATAQTGDKLGIDRHEIYFIGLHGENYKSLTVEGLDFRPTWTPQGDRLLYSSASAGSDWKPQLWVVDAEGDSIGANRHSISVNTWADKCTFVDNDNVYCAVPQDLPRGAGLQPKVVDDVSDDIYRINITTGLKSKVATPEGGHTIGKIMVSPDGGTLYFTDKASGILNTMKLK